MGKKPLMSLLQTPRARARVPPHHLRNRVGEGIVNSFFSRSQQSVWGIPRHHKKIGRGAFRLSGSHLSIIFFTREGGGKDPPFRPPQFHGATWNPYIEGPRRLEDSIKVLLKMDTFFFKYMCERIFPPFLKREIAGITGIFVLVSVEKREAVFVVCEGRRERRPFEKSRQSGHPPTHLPIGVLVVERDVSL